MGGWIQSGNYTPRKYGVEKAKVPLLKADADKTPSELNVLKGFIGTLKDGPRKAMRERKLDVRGKKK